MLYHGEVTASGRRHGSGLIRLVDGVTYSGKWRADEPSGAGVEEYPDGTTLKGVCTLHSDHMWCSCSTDQTLKKREYWSLYS